jgi:PiT family inorganic phosphate transporter
MTLTLVLLVALLAFANGSNDNGKGVATLVGFGVARPRTALLYATAATALGGAVSFWLAHGMLKGFAGGWLFDRSADLDPRFYVAVLTGACGWILFATRTGLPVSTTHAIIGALCGSGLVAFGNATVQWSALGAKFALPLALSPLLSLALVYALAFPVLFVVARLAGRCICVVDRVLESAPVMAGAGAAAAASLAPARVESHLGVITGTERSCAADGAGAVAAAVTASGAANAVHWLSGGLISFARGWNDTPKIAALSVLALSGVTNGTAIGFAIVLVAMALGGLLAGRRVLETMARKFTPLPLAESLTASLVTAALVALASWNNLPVSTTHVATGSIIGAGLTNDPAAVRWSKVGEVALSWVVTLPVAALIAAGAAYALR